MRFPDAVTILRAADEDEYGNPAADWTAPATTSARGFLIDRTLFVDRSADIRPGDRIAVAGVLFAIEEHPVMLRSPNRNVLWQLKLTRLPDGG